MKRNGLQIGVVCVAVIGCCWASASAQVVRIAPIVTSTPTPDTNAIFLGADPPPSAGLIDGASTFYVEVWATNVGVPFNGLACVHVDLLFDRTDLMDALSPTQRGPSDLRRSRGFGG